MKLNKLFLFAALLGFGNLVNAQYCIPTYTSNCMYGDDIDDFQLFSGGINHLGSGCSGGYGDYTATPGLTGTVEAGITYNFNVTHNFSSQYVKIWIDFNEDDSFNETDEMLFSSTTGSNVTTGSITIPVAAPSSTTRLRVMCVYASPVVDACTGGYYGEVHDYTVNVLPPPACLPVGNVTTTAISAFTADVDWDQLGGSSDFVIEWGAPGFTPGTLSYIGTDLISGTSNYTITGLTPQTSYEAYVLVNCGIDGFSQWAGPISFTTSCVPITTLPWTEGFETVTNIGMQEFPSCWAHENLSMWNMGWNVHDNFWAWGDADAFAGNNFLSCQYGSDAYIWTPGFDLTAGETYEFSFYWAGDEYDGWDGEVVINDLQNSLGATVIGVPFIEYGTYTTLEYTKVTYCFTPTVTGTYFYGIHVVETNYWYYLNIDEVSLKVASPLVGTDGSFDVCATEGLVDLNMMGSISDPSGAWAFDFNPFALVDDTLVNSTILPQGIYDAVFTPDGCLAPPVNVTLNILNPSSAGNDGTITACMNQQIDLLGALTGDVNLGGVWLDESDNTISSSYLLTGTTPGDYTYKYVATNGVCPSDTAEVTLTILTCDYLTLDENSNSFISIYPNPTTGLFVIEGSNIGENSQIIITDLNGKVVYRVDEFNKDLKIEVDFSNLESGIYLVNVLNNNTSQVYKLVKN